MESGRGLIEYRLTDHATFEMARRILNEQDIAQVLSNPEQVSEPGMYLLRVFVDTDRQPPEVVTVYRTSKVEKYWEATE